MTHAMHDTAGGGANRETCAARDAADPLAPLRDLFALERLDAQGVIYLDGNSLGVLPRTAIERVRQVVEDEWGEGLIRSWNSAGWITLSQRVADRIAPLVGAASGEIVVTDSTSINLYKVLSAAIALTTDPRRRRIVSERSNFPTDLYIASSLADTHGFELVLVDDERGDGDTSGADADRRVAGDAVSVASHRGGGSSSCSGHDGGSGPSPGGGTLAECFDGRLAILLLTHVNYRTGRMHRMAELTRAAHAAGALVVWDLAHSAGAVPVDLHGGGLPDDAADFAVGCGYKYLNGGPGAPAFAWAHPRLVARMDRERWPQPLAGWFGHAAPFDFTPEYRPAVGMTRFLCGTPPILSLAALACGVETLRAADGAGGLAALRAKSIALTDLFIELVESRCAGHGLTLVTPRDPDARGSQVSFAHPTGAYAMMQALIARGVIGDFRAPDLLRFGFTPLYTRFTDVWDAVDRLRDILATGAWRDPKFHVRSAVT